MRYLNKVIFINSAQIRYAEINLDGHVHFIGANGFGKSTLLRAILFFYNADPQGLGITKQKSPYVDYYFKNSNSYIIYEVIREDGKFCVVSYKSQHKVCFRFFNGEYREEYFVNINGNVPDSWEGIAQQLDANGIFYTKRKIDEYKEYRDIIYGNHEGKKHELKRFSILESKDYQQVPKTIQNVFLNSKMEADFIKQIIILSLDNDVRIDLNQYTHHLNDFETQLMDIRKFKMPSTRSQAENIAKLHIDIRNLECEKIQLAKNLAYAVTENERREPELAGKLTLQQNQKDKLNTKLNEIKNLFEKKKQELNGDIHVQNANYKKATELIAYYDKENIQEIIAKVEKKNDYEKEQTYLQEEQKLLSVQFTDIETKYKARYDALENQYKSFINGKKEQKINIRDEFSAYKDNLMNKFNEDISSLKEEYKIQIDFSNDSLESKEQIVGKLKFEKAKIELTHFFEKEIMNLEKEIQELDNSIKQLPIEKGNLSEQIENIRKRWELDEQNLQKDLERNKNDITAKIASVEENIFEKESYINNSQDSLYGWLTQNYPNWEKTIGKIIDEKKVLFNSALNPCLAEKSNNFYGVEIDLDEIDKTVKTIADYEAEKTELDVKIQQFKQSIIELSANLEIDKDKLKRKYNPEIRKRKNAIDEIEYRFEQSKRKHSETSIKIIELKNNAQRERMKQLEIINIEIDKAVENMKNAKADVKQLEELQSKAIEVKSKECKEIIETKNDGIKKVLAKIDVEMQAKETEYEDQKNEISNCKNEELSEKGADTKRLKEIEEKLLTLKNDLDFIDRNRDKVADYRKDKRDFIDKINEFKQEKQRLEEQLKFENMKYKEQETEIARELSKIQGLIDELDNDLKNIKEDFACFAEFRERDYFKLIAEYFGKSTNKVKTEKRIKVLIGEFDKNYYKKAQRTSELRTIATDFIGKFSENNILKFRKQEQIASENDLLAFAEELADFVEDQRIEQYEKEVSERFAFIVSTIGKETVNLMARSGEIQSIITKINNDFIERESIGIGVIKKIELRFEDSKNEIVQLLLEIKKYNYENSMEFGSQNLFSSDNQEKNNKQAVDLLKQFVKKIDESRKDEISISDSFELKFRIEENLNDTGWQEKLTNVGSEGTDTLIKAMLNIMLLNVFKESASKRFKDFRLHCMMDEIGKLHPNNVRGILKFANDRNISLINGSPIENDALAFTHIYKLHKDEGSITRVKRLITQYAEK
jgi:hypothetical protein